MDRNTKSIVMTEAVTARGSHIDSFFQPDQQHLFLAVARFFGPGCQSNLWVLQVPKFDPCPKNHQKIYI
jgi:hypothetical protein